MSIKQYVISALAGAISTASLIAVATPPKMQAMATPMRQVSVIYTCDNIPKFDPQEMGEIRELRYSCEAERQALLLVKTWEKDPMAGQVLEGE